MARQKFTLSEKSAEEVLKNFPAFAQIEKGKLVYQYDGPGFKGAIVFTRATFGDYVVCAIDSTGIVKKTIFHRVVKRSVLKEQVKYYLLYLQEGFE